MGQSLLGHTSWVNCVVVSTDGRYIVSGSDDHSALIWAASSGMKLGGPITHGSSINDVGISEDASLICTCSRNKAKLWNVEAGECVATFRDTTRLSNFRPAFTWSNPSSRNRVDQATYHSEGGGDIVLATFDHKGCWSAGDTSFTSRFDSFCKVMRN